MQCVGSDFPFFPHELPVSVERVVICENTRLDGDIDIAAPDDSVERVHLVFFTFGLQS